MIVGTDLKRVERITGRLTTGRVLLGGVLSGIWLGLFVGLVFALFAEGSAWAMVLSTVAFGAVFGAVWAVVGYAATRGRRGGFCVVGVVFTWLFVFLNVIVFIGFCAVVNKGFCGGGGGGVCFVGYYVILFFGFCFFWGFCGWGVFFLIFFL